MSKPFVMAKKADLASGQAPQQLVVRISRKLGQFERIAAGLVLMFVFAIVLLNVIARSMGAPIIWADELAIYGMAWAAFIGACCGLSGRNHIALTLLSDALSRHYASLLARAIDACLLVLLLCLAVILWNWFDPINFMLAGSANAYTSQSFNFMHQEPTTTLGFKKIWAWLVLPWFNLSALIHVAARFFERGAS